MTGQRGKKAGVKIGLVAGAILLMGFASAWLTPCSGMDALTQSEMGNLSGQYGISMGICGSSTIIASFQSIAMGDTDGWGNSQDDTAGWIVLIGTGSNWGYLTFTVPDGAQMTFDVATTGASTCAPSPYAAIKIPPNTPFFTFTLTKATIGLINPTTVNLRSNDTATESAGSMDPIGWMKPVGLAIDKADMKSTCYIWAHP
jgi:hypothetical protein